MHTVAVGDLVQGYTGFKRIAECEFSEPRFLFSRLVPLLPLPITSPRCARKSAPRPAFRKDFYCHD